MMGAWRMGEEEGAGLTERNQTENEPKVTVLYRPLLKMSWAYPNNSNSKTYY